jgi:formylglycine-generating enzyme required for sulfatase activity
LTQCYTIDNKKKDPNNKNQYDGQKWIVSCNFKANGYRLPTEAEWEYAARGGNQSKGYKYSGSDKMDEVGWYGAYNNNGNRSLYDGTAAVGLNLSNELGIYDMSGNVYEWVWDWYGEKYYLRLERTNPKGESFGSGRGLRGGSWDDGSEYCRVAARHDYFPDNRDFYSGFRLLRTIL